jgi:transposase-like protein
MKDILVHLILSLVNFLLNRAHKPEISPLRTDQNEALPQPTCPKCGSSHTIKNGSIHNGKKKWLYRSNYAVWDKIMRKILPDKGLQ